jgi:two-component sensor histidine kinase
MKELKERVQLRISDSESMPVELKFDERQVGIDVKIAIPVALLIFELVIYAKKHLTDLVTGLSLNIYQTTQNLYFSCHYEADEGHPLLNLEYADKLEIQLTNAFLKQLNAYARVESDKTETVIYAEIPLEG